MNPPSPSVPSMTPELPSAVGSGETEFVISNLPAEPTSIDVVVTAASSQPQTEEIVGKAQNASLYSDGAKLSAALAFADGVATFAITNQRMSQEDTFSRVIVVADGQTFTFE